MPLLRTLKAAALMLVDPHDTPRQALEEFWPCVKRIFESRSVPVEYWPLATALVARQFLLWSKGTIDPRVSVALMMESSIVMSKIGPKTVPPDWPKDVPPQPPRK